MEEAQPPPPPPMASTPASLISTAAGPAAGVATRSAATSTLQVVRYSPSPRAPATATRAPSSTSPCWAKYPPAAARPRSGETAPQVERRRPTPRAGLEPPLSNPPLASPPRGACLTPMSRGVAGAPLSADAAAEMAMPPSRKTRSALSPTEGSPQGGRLAPPWPRDPAVAPPADAESANVRKRTTTVSKRGCQKTIEMMTAAKTAPTAAPPPPLTPTLTKLETLRHQLPTTAAAVLAVAAA